MSHLCVNTLPAVETLCSKEKETVSALPNVGPYIFDVNISGFTSSSIYIYIYDISSLRVNVTGLFINYV